MWNIIPQIGTPIALAAFAIALFYLFQRQRLKNRLEAIQSAPADERAALVEITLDKFHIDADGLTRTQRYNLIQQRLTQRADQAKMLIISGSLISLVTLLVVGSVYLFKDVLHVIKDLPKQSTFSLDQKNTIVLVAPGCVVTTGLMTSLNDKPDLINGIDLHELPANQTYKVLAHEIYHHGPVAIRFFKIRDSDGVEGWVSAQKLAKVHPNCLK